jgi:hypothetical protein
MRFLEDVLEFINSSAHDRAKGRNLIQAQLDLVALRLNQRPRKTLSFQTPAARLQASVASTVSAGRVRRQLLTSATIATFCTAFFTGGDAHDISVLDTDRCSTGEIWLN